MVGKSAKKRSLKFEEALEKVESLVETIERGEIPLDEVVEKFEEGIELIKFCQNKLNQAELKIEKLSEETKALESFNDLQSD